jgi:hypothetical protein
MNTPAARARPRTMCEVATRSLDPLQGVGDFLTEGHPWQLVAMTSAPPAIRRQEGSNRNMLPAGVHKIDGYLGFAGCIRRRRYRARIAPVTDANHGGLGRTGEAGTDAEQLTAISAAAVVTMRRTRSLRGGRARVNRADHRDPLRGGGRRGLGWPSAGRAWRGEGRHPAQRFRFPAGSTRPLDRKRRDEWAVVAAA